MHGDYFWAKFIEDSYYFERPPPKTLAFNNNIFDGCRMISCGVPNSLQKHIFGEESFMWCHRTLCFAKYWNSFFQEKFKKMKIHHRKHKKCCVLNTLCLRSLVFPTRFDWQNISFCKTGVATTTIPTTTFHIFSKFFKRFKIFKKNQDFFKMLSDFENVNMALYRQEVQFSQRTVFSM